jgi:hypothetical protein
VTVEHRNIVESFSGVGPTIREALGDGFDKFTRGSLHVMIAMADRPELGSEEVTWATWGAYEVCLGPLLKLWSSAGPFEISAYLDHVKGLVLNEGLSPETHWIGTFVATDGQQIIGREMLLDNTSWVSGEQLLDDFPWPLAEEQYALRHFMALRPLDKGLGETAL